MGVSDRERAREPGPQSRRASWLVFLLLCSGTGSQAAGQTRHTHEARLMGCAWRIVLDAPAARETSSAAEAAFDRIRQIEKALSDWEPESALRRFGKTAGSSGFQDLDPDLGRALVEARRWARWSGGAFDPTLGALVPLWRRTLLTGRLPAVEALERARASVDWRRLELSADGRRGRLAAAGARLDLGGFAKGWAADQALQVLRRSGFRRALVEGGGDLAVGAPPRGDRGWRIVIEPVEGRPLPPALQIRHASVATSGTSARHVVIDGQRFGHLLDPRSGRGVSHRRQVTVVAAEGGQADAIASACSILTPSESIALIERTAGVEILIQDPDGVDRESSGFRDWRAR